jgi:hypothetical protein
MAAVIETFHRYVTIWTCMGSAGTITAALYTAHQMARTRGIQSRILLAMLVEIDNGQHLDAPSREHVSADIAAFTHVSSLSPFMKLFFNLSLRLFTPTPRHPIMSRLSFLKYYSSRMILILRLPPSLPIAFGTNIELHLTGPGKFGTIPSPVCDKFP